MKKLLYLLLAITFMGCSDSGDEDCGCVKTTKRNGWRWDGNGRYETILSIENVPCQDNNIPYVFVSGNTALSDNVVSYSICCDNINDPDSGCD